MFTEAPLGRVAATFKVSGMISAVKPALGPELITLVLLAGLPSSPESR